MDKNLIYKILLGSIIGIISGITGLANDELIIISLILFNLVKNIHIATASILLIFILPTRFGILYNYYKKNLIDFKLAFTIMIPYLFFSYISSLYAVDFSDKTLYLFNIIILSFIVFLYILKYVEFI